MRLIFDIETDGIEATKVHCIVARDADTGEVRSFGPSQIKEGCDWLSRADMLIGHNIQSYDLPVLCRLGYRVLARSVRDTLICSRLIWPDVQQDDWARTSSGFPKNMVGRHSLAAWGYRLGIRKDSWGETTDWSAYSDEMLAYCVRDTEVTLALWRAIQGEQPDERSIDIEHRFAAVMHEMTNAGFAFDRDAASRLCSTLMERREELRVTLEERFGPTVIKLKTKVKERPFCPSSRMDIAAGLRRLHGWEPTAFTADGRVKVDEAVLTALPYPEAKSLLEYLTVVKRLGQIAEGDEAWMKLVSADGRIRGRVNANGAVTGRCTHSKPNMAQVPSSRSLYGAECRACFVPQQGWCLVGADASALELRCLAHYMAQWDGGAYAREVCDGDIHTVNQKAAGLKSRDDAKVFIYSFLYGAGDGKIGSIVGGDWKAGKKLKTQFLKRTPALKQLRDRVQQAAKERGWLVGLDGRRLPVRSPHSALNLLLQSAGAVAMKVATVIMVEELSNANIRWGRDYRLVAHIHDEIQIECDRGLASEIGCVAVDAFRLAGERLNMRCPLAGEWRSGLSWAETH